MATNALKQFGQAQVASGSQTTIYTAPATAGSYGLLLDVQICNTTAVDQTIEAWVVPSGGSINDNNKILSNISVRKNYIYPMTGRKIIIPAGGTLQMEASLAASITVTASGYEHDAA